MHCFLNIVTRAAKDRNKVIADYLGMTEANNLVSHGNHLIKFESSVSKLPAGLVLLLFDFWNTGGEC